MANPDKKIKPKLLKFLSVLILVISMFCFVNFSTAAGVPSIKINKEQSTTKTRKVTLYLTGPDEVKWMKVSNEVDFPGANWEAFAKTKEWYLDYGAGTKTVYVKYKDKKGNIGQIRKDTIQLSVPANMTVDFKINDDDKETNSRYVSLAISWTEGVESMRISNENKFTGIDWQPVGKGIIWVLSADSGKKTVYIEFEDANEKTKVVSKTIQYNQPANYIPGGSLLKGQASTVYYLGFDGMIHPFVNSAVYHSWHEGFDNIKYVSNAKLGQYMVGNPVCVRPGTWLVKFASSNRVYASEPGCQLYPLKSESEAFILYGRNWNKRVLELSSVFSNYYTILNPQVEEDLDDSDKDGVDDDTEIEYGSSNKSSDSDKDGLHDYEEIYYWFSDPTVKDTDGDGFNDGIEVIYGYSPVGVGKLDELTGGTYLYLPGSLIKAVDGKYYYRKLNGKFYSVSDNTSGSVFKSNNFNSRFVIEETFDLPFAAPSKLGSEDDQVIYPQILTPSGALANL